MDKDKLENKVDKKQEVLLALIEEGKAFLNQPYIRRSLRLAQTIRLSAPPRRYSLINNYQ